MISIIAIIGKNRELGKDNRLLWDIPEDMKRFRELTYERPVIMGRKTHESIGKRLEGRDNIIVTRDENYQASGCTVVSSLEEAIKYGKQINTEEIFVIGGEQIYRQALPYTDKLYLTVVDKEAKADSFFPEYSEFKNVIQEEKKETKDELKYKFLELRR